MGISLTNHAFRFLWGGNADGSHRLTPVVVGKLAKPRALKDVMDRIPVHYYHSKNAWLTSAMFNRDFS